MTTTTSTRPTKGVRYAVGKLADRRWILDFYDIATAELIWSTELNTRAEAVRVGEALSYTPRPNEFLYI
jgi:hypothetical protein